MPISRSAAQLKLRSLNGRVLIDRLSFTPDFDLASFGDQFSTGDAPSQPGFADTVKLAIGVQSQGDLNARSSQISIAGQAALQVSGTAANPVITGRTTLTSGELFYRNVRYQLQKGVITFNDPNETHPVLNVSVGTTVEQYNLTLTMRGPLDKLTTSYVSDPPLATADIINLIARGKTTQESAASSQSTDSMIASQAASEVSSSVQKLAGISSLEIDPMIGGNNQNPSARIAIQQRVTKNLLFTFSTDVSQPGERDRARRISNHQAMVGKHGARSTRRNLHRRPLPHPFLAFKSSIHEGASQGAKQVRCLISRIHCEKVVFGEVCSRSRPQIVPSPRPPRNSALSAVQASKL